LHLAFHLKHRSVVIIACATKNRDLPLQTVSDVEQDSINDN